MPIRIPKYRKRPDRNVGFVESPRGCRVYFPGRYDSPESRAAYNQWLRGHLGEPEAGVTMPDNPGCVQVADLVLCFLDWAKLYYLRDGKAGSEYHCLRAATIPLLKIADCVLVQHFGPKNLKAVRADMIERRWTRDTINDQIGRVRRIFKWGVEHEVVKESVWRTLQAVSPLSKGRTAAPESRGVMPVDRAIIEATLPFLGPVVAAMVQLQQASGMRPQDVCGIRPIDVDQSGDVWLYCPESHKNDWREGGQSTRIVAIGPKAQAALRPWLDRDSQAYCFSPLESEGMRRTARGRGKRRPLHKPGTHYTHASYRRAVQRAARAAGVAKWHPNQLRHTAATAVRKAFGLEAAQVYLGHAKADVTQVYAARDMELAEKIAREIG
jgi:integrase